MISTLLRSRASWESSEVIPKDIPDEIRVFEERRRLERKRAQKLRRKTWTVRNCKVGETTTDSSDSCSFGERRRQARRRKKRRGCLFSRRYAGDCEYGFDRGLEPETIIGATDANGSLEFLIKWRNCDDRELVPAKVANARCPQMVIRFYEQHFEWKTDGL